VLQRVLGQLVERDLHNQGLLPALTDVTAAMPSLFDVDGAGVLLLDEGQVLRYFAATDSSAHFLEAVQESTGQGPCVQSLVEDEMVETDDILVDERWPDLGRLLVDNGVRAILGAPIRLAGASIGSLNVYKSVAHAWDDSDRRALVSFNRVVENLVTAAVVADRNEGIVQQLREALQARVAIERAVGIVMAVEGVDATVAFERLRRNARSCRKPIREVAAEVVQFRKLP
jgi:GAF domain-containing protein